jgi:hypothetical protein
LPWCAWIPLMCRCNKSGFADGTPVGVTNHVLLLPIGTYTITLESSDFNPSAPSAIDVDLQGTSLVRPKVVSLSIDHQPRPVVRERRAGASQRLRSGGAEVRSEFAKVLNFATAFPTKLNGEAGALLLTSPSNWSAVSTGCLRLRSSTPLSCKSASYSR